MREFRFVIVDAVGHADVMTRIFLSAALACLVAAPAAAERQQSVAEWLRAQHGDSSVPGIEETRYALAYVDLNGDGRDEAIVYVQSQGMCGTGGCDFTILTPDAHSWREVASMSVTQLPIRLLDTSSRGWRDISVTVGGGGIRRQEAILSFDGNSYPDNPTVPPARPAETSPAGRILIPADSEGTLLFP